MRIIIMTFFIGFISACNSKKTECKSEFLCTQDVRVVKVNVSHPDGTAVALDSFFSFFPNGNSFLIHSNGFTAYQLADIRKYGDYPIAGDNMVNLTSKNGRPVKFYGFKNNIRVIDETFTIGHDCCHVELRAGKAQIVVQ